MTANTNFSDFISRGKCIIAAMENEYDRVKQCVLLESYVDLVEEAFTFSPHHFASWKKVTIKKATQWQQDSKCTYELWLRCEKFLAKYTNRCMIPADSWTEKDTTKWCSIKTLKGKVCRNYSVKGSNACHSHGGKY